jgi:hypothetical protein
VLGEVSADHGELTSQASEAIIIEKNVQQLEIAVNDLLTMQSNTDENHIAILNSELRRASAAQKRIKGRASQTRFCDEGVLEGRRRIHERHQKMAPEVNKLMPFELCKHQKSKSCFAVGRRMDLKENFIVAASADCLAKIKIVTEEMDERISSGKRH